MGHHLVIPVKLNLYTDKVTHHDFREFTYRNAKLMSQLLLQGNTMGLGIRIAGSTNSSNRVYT